MNQIKIYSKNITPEDATKILSKNDGNRRLSQRYVQYYYNQMVKGDWSLTGDPIKIGKSGKLLDGQHRLQAIIKLNKPVEMFIAENVDDHVFAVLDTGKNRSAGDVLETKGFRKSANLAGTSRAILLYKSGYFATDGGGATKNSKATNKQVLEFVESTPVIHDVVQYVQGIQRQFRFMPVSSLGMLYFILSKRNQTKTDSFFEKYATGIDLSESSPIRLLRDRLVRDRMNKTKLSAKDKTALFIMAWNSFVTGNRKQQLTLQKNYKFPKPV